MDKQRDIFRSVKKQWRLVFGSSFIAGGLPYINATPVSAWIMIIIGIILIMWHLVRLFLQLKSRRHL